MVTSPSQPLSPASVPLAVWPAAPTSADHQQSDVSSHPRSCRPEAVPPGLAAQILTAYSASGQLVVDPMGGDGAIVVEAARLGRRAVGIAPRPRQGALAGSSLGTRLDATRRGLVEVIVGGAVRLPELLGSRTGSVDLVVLGAPGCRIRALHTPTRPEEGQRIARNADEELPRARAARRNTGPSTAAVAALYDACLAVLRPGGLLVTIPADSPARGDCVDGGPTSVELAQQAGFGYLQHVIALRAAIRDGLLDARPSSRELSELQAARDRGQPSHAVVHTNVFVFTKPAVSR